MIVLQPTHKLGAMLQVLQQDERLCNVQLHVSDATAAVHGCVLASQCSAAIAERVYHVLHDHTRPAELYLSQPDHKAPCKSDTLRRVIAFLYGQPLEVQDDAFNEVLHLSLLLGLSDISERLVKAVAGPQQDVKGDLCEFATDVLQCNLDNEASHRPDFTRIDPSKSLNTELSSSLHTAFQRQNDVSLATDEEFACRDGSEAIFNSAAIDQLGNTWPANEVSECFTILPTSNSLSKITTIDVSDDKMLDVDRKGIAILSAYTIDRGLNISCRSGMDPPPDTDVNTEDSFDVRTVLESAYNNEMTAEMCTLNEKNHVTCGDEVDCLIELTIKEDAKDSCPDITRTHNYITDTSYLCLQEGFANNSEHTDLTNAMNSKKNSSKKRLSKQQCLSPSTSKRRKHFLLPNISDDTNIKVMGKAHTSSSQYELLSRTLTSPDSFTTTVETSALYTSESKGATGDEKVCSDAASSPTMSGAGLRCGVCHSYYRRCSDLVKHVLEQQHHSRTCPICAFQSSDAASQRRHFSLHDSPLPFLCGGCDLRFRTRAHLAMHVPKHSSKRPFSCTECGRTFKWRHAQQAHMLRHRAEGHLLCDVCGFSSSYISTFKAHLQQHTGQAFQCPHTGCSFKAFRKNNLKSHLVTHSNVRPHQCDVCGNSFSLARNLSRHMKLHLTARLLCSATSGTACAFTTTRPDKLRAHLHHKHGIRPDGTTKFTVTEGPENAAAGDADKSCFESSSVEAIGSVIYDRKCKVRRTDAVASVKFKNVIVVPENPTGFSTTNASSSEIVHLVSNEEYARVKVNTSIAPDLVSCSSEMISQKPNLKRKRKAILNPLKEPMKIISDLDGGIKEDAKPSKSKFRKKKIEIPAAMKHSNSIPTYSRSKVVASRRSSRKLASVANPHRHAVSIKTKMCSPTKTRTASGSPWSVCVPVSFVHQSSSDPLSRQSDVSYVLTSNFNAGTTILNTLSDSGKDLSDSEVSRIADTSFNASTFMLPRLATESLPVSVAEDVHFTSYVTSLSERPAQPMTLEQPNSSASFAVSQSPCSFSLDTSRQNQLYTISDSNSVTSILVSIAYENPDENRVANETERPENVIAKTDLVSSHGSAYNTKIDSSQLHSSPGPIREQSQLHTHPGPSPDTPRASYSAGDPDARHSLFRAVTDELADNTAGSSKLPGFNSSSNSFRLVSDQSSDPERCLSTNRIAPVNDSAASDGLFAGVMQPEGSEELQFLHLQDCEVSLLPHQSKETISFLGPVLDCIEERNIEEVPKNLDVTSIPDGHAETRVPVLSSIRTTDVVDLLNNAGRRQHPNPIEESQTENLSVELTMCPTQQCQNLCQSEAVLERLEPSSVGESSSKAMKDGGVDSSLEVPGEMATVAGPMIDSHQTVPEDGRCLTLDASSFDSLVQSLAALD